MTKIVDQKIVDQKIVDQKIVDLDFEPRPDGKYNVWQSRTLVELGELTEKKAYNIYTKYSVDIPSRWMLIDVVDQPENS